MRTTSGDSTTRFITRIGSDPIGHDPAVPPHVPCVCIRCGAVGRPLRHAVDITLPGEVVSVEGHAALCVPCRMAAAGECGGEVRLFGGFVSEHQAEIERLIRKEAACSMEDDPDERLLRVERPARGRLTVTTSTGRLAGRIGRALHGEFRGTTHYDVVRDCAFTRVTWLRDE